MASGRRWIHNDKKGEHLWQGPDSKQAAQVKQKGNCFLKTLQALPVIHPRTIRQSKHIPSAKILAQHNCIVNRSLIVESLTAQRSEDGGAHPCYRPWHKQGFPHVRCALESTPKSPDPLHESGQFTSWHQPCSFTDLVQNRQSWKTKRNEMEQIANAKL